MDSDGSNSDSDGLGSNSDGSDHTDRSSYGSSPSYDENTDDGSHKSDSDSEYELEQMPGTSGDQTPPPRKTKVKKMKKNDVDEDDTTGGWTNDELCKLLKQKVVKSGPPPPPTRSRRFKAKAWKNGMKFLYYEGTNEEILNWYYCEKCGRFINCSLRGGTNPVRNHANSHLRATKYTFTRQELELLLDHATRFGSRTGHVMAGNYQLPPADNW